MKHLQFTIVIMEAENSLLVESFITFVYVLVKVS